MFKYTDVFLKNNKNKQPNKYTVYILLHLEQEIVLVEDCICGYQPPTVHHPQLPKHRPQRKTARQTLKNKKMASNKKYTRIGSWGDCLPPFFDIIRP